MLSKSFEQMLSAAPTKSQELHHNADCDFSHNFQYVIWVLNLITRLAAAFFKAI